LVSKLFFQNRTHFVVKAGLDRFPVKLSMVRWTTRSIETLDGADIQRTTETHIDGRTDQTTETLFSLLL
jgi:hypothetical protein